jgi:DNA polymerase-3 subunit gamma/tau
VAERFSEEDLSRFMQIMLRTHGELGYKQEQRFHLELGLLKLVHAQRLLPLEQLLSGEAAQPKSGGTAAAARSGSAQSAVSGAARPVSGTSRPREAEVRPPAAAVSPFARPSPFEADRSRKTEPKAEAPMGSPAAAPVATGTASAAAGTSIAEATSTSGGVATAVAIAEDEVAETASQEVNVDVLRNAILAALEDAGQNMLAHNLEGGEWSLRGS